MITDFAALEECNKTREVAIRALKLAVQKLETLESKEAIAETLSLSTALITAAQECKDRYGDEYPHNPPEQKQEMEDLVHQLLTMMHKHKTSQKIAASKYPKNPKNGPES